MSRVEAEVEIGKDAAGDGRRGRPPRHDLEAARRAAEPGAHRREHLVAARLQRERVRQEHLRMDRTWLAGSLHAPLVEYIDFVAQGQVRK